MSEGRITTVLGEIESEKIGFCQCHEHLLLSKGESYHVNPALFFDEEEKSFCELKSYQQAGGDSIVEAQPVGCNRMTEGLARISKASGIHVIASTGFHKMIFYPKNHWIFHMSQERLSEVFESELLEGMYRNCDQKEPKTRTTYRAGIVKTALDAGPFTKQYQRLFQAAAQTCIHTKRTMMIHVEKGADAVKLLTYLLDLGMQAKQLIFCHMDRACEDIFTHLTLCKAGAYLEYDTIGRSKYHSDEVEIDLMKQIMENGYEEQLLFSLDTTRNRLKEYGGEVGLTYIQKKFIPQMLENGVTIEQIHKISHDNCIRVLSHES